MIAPNHGIVIGLAYLLLHVWPTRACTSSAQNLKSWEEKRLQVQVMLPFGKTKNNIAAIEKQHAIYEI